MCPEEGRDKRRQRDRGGVIRNSRLMSLRLTYSLDVLATTCADTKGERGGIIRNPRLIIHFCLLLGRTPNASSSFDPRFLHYHFTEVLK